MATIALDLASFRVNFAEFLDPAVYSDAAITVKWAIATCYVTDMDYGRLNGSCRELAIQSMTAHLLRITDNIATGTSTGQVTGASEDSVSISLEAPKTRNQYQWWLNTTEYGQQYNVLLSSAIVGGIYVGGSREREGFRKYGSRF